MATDQRRPEAVALANANGATEAGMCQGGQVNLTCAMVKSWI